jgi:hypothetical protein
MVSSIAAARLVMLEAKTRVRGRMVLVRRNINLITHLMGALAYFW